MRPNGLDAIDYRWHFGPSAAVGVGPHWCFDRADTRIELCAEPAVCSWRVPSLAASTPIFIGGMIRMAVDKWQGNKPGSEDDSSPAVLLSSGYIAGGAIAAVLISFMNFKKEWLEAINLEGYMPTMDLVP